MSHLMFIRLKFPKLNLYLLKLIAISPSLKNNKVYFDEIPLFCCLRSIQSQAALVFLLFCQTFSSLVQHFLAMFGAAILTYNPSRLPGICAQNRILFPGHGVLHPNTHPSSHGQICFSPCYWPFLHRNVFPKPVHPGEFSRFHNLCDLISNAVSPPL